MNNVQCPSSQFEPLVSLHGDCMNLLPALASESVDMILCDLPYGTTACKWDVVIPFEPLWKEYKRICKPNAAIVLFGSEPFSSHLRLSNIRDYKYDWIWEKERPSNFMMSKKQPLKIHENISVFCGNKYFPIMRELSAQGKARNGRRRDSGFKATETVYGDYSHFKMEQTIGRTKGYPKTIIKISREVNNQFKKQVFHPTQKPIALLEYLIKTYTQKGETVLDNCMGSGTTGVACVNTGRRFIGMEKEEKYFVIASKRISNALNAVSNERGCAKLRQDRDKSLIVLCPAT